ncbi:MAG: hypothetical protein C4523_06080 [Myxococcales bacterium]|nr:MAG: hypothetical protein C4523_06080 [Myxococcales bacterium]
MGDGHLYAFKHGGRTLGVKDNAQLERLLESGKIPAEAKVFVLAEKRWLPVTEILGRPEKEAAVAPAAQDPNATLVLPRASNNARPPTREFAALIHELDAGSESSLSPAAATLRDNSDGEALVESRRTIHKLPDAKRRSARLTKTVVAAKVPNPEGHWPYRFAAIAAVLALLAGLAAGFAGSTYLFDSAMGHSATPVFQANTASPDQDAAETNN